MVVERAAAPSIDRAQRFGGRLRNFELLGQMFDKLAWDDFGCAQQIPRQPNETKLQGGADSVCPVKLPQRR
jgi:hypothetical protein